MKILINHRVILLLFILATFSCSDVNTTEDKDEFNLVSPTGFKIANNLKQLKSYINLDNKDDIIKIEFYGSGLSSFALVYYGQDGIIKNFGISRQNERNIEEETGNATNSKNLNDTVWITQCVGCEGCTIRGTMDEDFTQIQTCSNECCSMKITKRTSLEP